MKFDESSSKEISRNPEAVLTINSPFIKLTPLLGCCPRTDRNRSWGFGAANTRVFESPQCAGSSGLIFENKFARVARKPFSNDFTAQFWSERVPLPCFDEKYFQRSVVVSRSQCSFGWKQSSRGRRPRQIDKRRDGGETKEEGGKMAVQFRIGTFGDFCRTQIY